MAENGDTIATIAKALELSAPSVSFKINGTNGREFKARELQTLKERWNLTADQAAAVFFPEQ